MDYLKSIIALLLCLVLFLFYKMMNIQDTFIVGTMASSAAVLLGFAVVYFFLERKGISSSVQLQERISKTILERLSTTSRYGLQEVFVDRDQSFHISEYGKWNTYLSYSGGTNQCIDALGINLDSLFGYEKIPDRADIKKIDFLKYERVMTIVNRVNNGANVRVAVPGIDSEYLRLRAKTEAVDSPIERWRERLTLNKAIFEHIKSTYIATDRRRDFVLKEYDNILYYFMLRSNDLMIVAPYLNYVKGGNSPAFVLRDDGSVSSLFKKFSDDFQVIWDA